MSKADLESRVAELERRLDLTMRFIDRWRNALVDHPLEWSVGVSLEWEDEKRRIKEGTPNG